MFCTESIDPESDTLPTEHLGNFKKNEDFSVIKFFVNFIDEIHIHFI